MRRLAIFWLACAAVGFVAAIGAACALSLALDGAGVWRGAPPPPRLVQRKGAALPNNTAPIRPQGFLAPMLGSAN